MSNVVIKIENLSKLYRLGEVGTGTVSHDLNRWFAKIRGKEDPFALVGQTNDRSKKAESDYVWVLKNINLEISKGEVIGIIGKNGAGKSTLLKIISQITSPTEGLIKAKGRIASLLEVGTGMHPQMTARENIYLNGSILGMRKEEIRAKFDEIIDFAGCAMYVDTPIKRFSSGMRVRLGFAVAAFLEPEILIVDEVLAVGDAEFQQKAIGKMKEVSKGGGRTVLFVSHNMTSIKSLCSSAILLEQGQIVMRGPTEDVIEGYLNRNFEAQGNLPVKVFKNEPYTLHKIELLGAQTNKYVDSSNIEIAFTINVPEAKGIDLNISFFSSNNEKLFMFFGREIVGGDFKDGENVIKLKLPKDLLNKGSYYINFAIHRNHREFFHSEKEAFVFEVEENIFKFNKYKNIDAGKLNIEL